MEPPAWAWPPSQRRFRLVLVALPILALANMPLRGIDSTVDLLVVLMVSVALGDPRYFVDPLVGLLRVLLGVGLRLLLQVVELAHTVLQCHWPALPPGRIFLRANSTPGTDAPDVFRARGHAKPDGVAGFEGAYARGPALIAEHCVGPSVSCALQT